MVCPQGSSLEPCDNAEDRWLGFKSGGGAEWGRMIVFSQSKRPVGQQDELQRVAVFLSGSIIFGFQQPSFVLKCPALGSLHEEPS